MKTLKQFRVEKDPRGEINRLRRDLKRTQDDLRVAQALQAAVGDTAKLAAKIRTPKWAAKTAGDSAPGVPTLLLSDFHWGEVVNPKEINGVNRFNLEIARARLKRTVQKTIKLLRLLDPKMRYPGIVVPLAGDMVTGDIHEELTATNELPTIPTVLDLYEHLVPALQLFADTFGNIFVPCVSGNHDRNTRKTYSKLRNHTSFGWLLYQMLAKKFAGDARVTFYIPDGSDAYYRVAGLRFGLTHGDQFRGGDGIIGHIGPVMRGDQKKRARNQAVSMPYDLLQMGHWHTYLQTARILTNGSLKGYDEYAYQNNFGFEPPQQALYTTHPEVGINWRMPVLCDAIERPSAAPSVEWVEVPRDKK